MYCGDLGTNRSAKKTFLILLTELVNSTRTKRIKHRTTSKPCSLSLSGSYALRNASYAFMLSILVWKSNDAIGSSR